MWYITFLKLFLGSKVQSKDQQNLNKDINSIFDNLSSVNHSAPPLLEAVLHILSYMKRGYFDVPPQNTSLTQVTDDLKSAIIIAEKMTDDEGIWIEDYVPQFGRVDTLKKNERLFWGDTLKHDAAMNEEDILILFRQLEKSSVISGLVISGFILDALKLKQENPSEDISFLDTLLSDPVVGKYNTESLRNASIPEKKGLECESNESQPNPEMNEEDSRQLEEPPGISGIIANAPKQEQENPSEDSFLLETLLPDPAVKKYHNESLRNSFTPEEKGLECKSHEPPLTSSTELLELATKTIHHYISSRQNRFFNLFRNSGLTSEKVKLAQQLVRQLETAKRNPIGLGELSAIFKSFTDKNNNLERRLNKSYNPGFSSGFDRVLEKCAMAVKSERELQNVQQSRPH